MTDKFLRAAERRVWEGKDQLEEYEIPSSDGEAIILSRDRAEIFRLLEEAYAFGIYEQAIISAVALTEDYLQAELKIVLRWFPEKLKQNVAGEKLDRPVSLDMILTAKCTKQLVSRLIDQRLQGIFHGAPSRYFEYIESILKIELPRDLKDRFVEIKATRDASTDRGLTFFSCHQRRPSMRGAKICSISESTLLANSQRSRSANAVL